MKLAKLFTTALIASTFVGPAFAADLPSRKAPVAVAPAPMLSWSGFYVGVNAGGTFGGDATRVVTTPVWADPINALTPSASIAAAIAGTNTFSKTSGFIGGGQIGYNFQINPLVVAGLEADIQGVATGSGSSSATAAAAWLVDPTRSTVTTTTASKRLDYLGTLRGRLGFLPTPSLLLYGTGGLAYGGARSAATLASTFAGSTLFGWSYNWGAANAYSGARAGWTIGVGAEWMFAQNWSAKVEYLYYDLGTATYQALAINTYTSGAAAFTNATTVQTRFNGHIVRAGLNYHFNFGGTAPIVAKY